MEGMKDIPKDTWEDKFREVVEYLQKAGVRPEGREDKDNSGDNNNGEEAENPGLYHRGNALPRSKRGELRYHNRQTTHPDHWHVPPRSTHRTWMRP